MAGISDEAFGTMESKRKFVGQEFNHDEFSDGSGLDWYDFKFRKMDPQIGRFLQVDPLADKYPYNSTYAYAEDKPINGIDLEGLEWVNFLTSFEKPKDLYLKPPPTGNGVQIQSYSVTVHGSKKSFSDFYTTFKNEPQAILDNSKADFIPVNGEG